MSDRLHGRCHCGGVAFTIPATSGGVVACHCEDCRKMHGNCNVVLAAPRDDVQFEPDATLHWMPVPTRPGAGFAPNAGRVCSRTTSGLTG